MLHIVWDPELGIKIGSIFLKYYSLMFALAFAMGWLIMYYIVKREKIDKKYLDPLFIYMFIGVMLGGRLGHVIFYEPQIFTKDFLSVFLPFQFNPTFTFTGFHGLASHGAFIGGLISCYLFSKKISKPFLWYMDRITIPVMLGCALARIGNFFNSEIIGKPFNGEWAVLFKQQSFYYGEIVPRHASQLYESIGYFLLFILASVLYLKTNLKQNKGQIFSIILIFGFLVRFLVEFLKEPQGNEMISFLGLNSGQILSIPPILVGIFLFFIIQQKKTRFSIK